MVRGAVARDGQVVQEAKLSEVLSNFARTLSTDFPIQGILDRLVESIVEVLPITAAGVTLISAGKVPRYVAASDVLALRFEQLQTDVGDGPCLLAYESGKPVSVPDLAHEDRWGRFVPEALEAGLVAVFTFPLLQGEARLGALDLYRDTAGALEPHALYVAQTLADVAAAYLINARGREEALTASATFEYRSLHDALTGLPNRQALQVRLEHAAARARRSRTSSAILFADLDGFKAVNDTYGHHTGDELLLAVADRLSSLLRAGDTLVRLGGDEFVFLCEDLSNPSDVEILTTRISAAFYSPFRLTDVELAITASVGVAFAGPGERISDELLVKADLAMYRAKRIGGGSKIIDLRDALATNVRESLEHDLRTALASGGLDVAYQPIVRSADGLMTGVEALLRWNDPDRGAVSPALMVAAAERSDLILEIGQWLLTRSCADRSRWVSEHPGTPLDLCVNVSARQLMTPGLNAAVAHVLSETSMDPAALILEMTETVFIADAERTMMVLKDLADLGVRLALDDFGTGYSSLNYLTRFPVDIVKIDQSFTANIGQSPKDVAVMAAVTNLAHVLDLTVTAEGVETEHQRDGVQALGCDSAQGYYYARPMPAAAISAHLSGTTGPPHLPAFQ